MFKANGGFQPDEKSKAVGGYDAVRVYLWAGMLAADEPARAVLLKRFTPMADFVQKNGTPPLEAATREGNASGIGPVGFSAALLPFLAASRLTDAQRQQQLRVEAKSPLERADNYYDQALTLFGQGWIDGRYRFARDGALQPNWKCARN
jgi:endoglucanase